MKVGRDYGFNQFGMRTVLLVGTTCLLVTLLLYGAFRLLTRAETPQEAPEAEDVLNAQLQLPFQVLIPAYLPKNFLRDKTEIHTENMGPNGEPMIQLVYPTRQGENLTFYEWIPDGEAVIGPRAYCRCVCVSSKECKSVERGFSIGSLHLIAKVSAPDIITGVEASIILDTLGPAVNRQVFSSIKDVPVSYSVPAAVDIPVNADGIQEVTLVVTPNGYSPAHMAVQKGVAVKLIFRQLGQVGCGNTLVFNWGKGKSATLYLASQDDMQTLEFTPAESGEFRFNCPHLFFRGVLTVRD